MNLVDIWKVSSGYCTLHYIYITIYIIVITINIINPKQYVGTPGELEVRILRHNLVIVVYIACYMGSLACMYVEASRTADWTSTGMVYQCCSWSAEPGK